MIKVQFTYFEIQTEDFTGIRIRLIDENDVIAATYQNFNPKDYLDTNESESDKVWENQTEDFEVGTLELAKQFVESNMNYLEVKKVW